MKNLATNGLSTQITTLIEQAPNIQGEIEAAKDYLAQFENLKIVDAETYRAAKVYASEIRTKRLDLDKQFTGASSALKTLVKSYDKQAADLLIIYKNSELAIREEIKRVDDERQAEKEAAERAAAEKYLNRTNQLFEAGYTYDGHTYTCGVVYIGPSTIEDIDDEQFENYLERGRVEAQRIARILADAKQKTEQTVEVVLRDEPTTSNDNPSDWLTVPDAPPVAPNSPPVVPDDFFSKPEPPAENVSFRPPGYTAGFDAAKNAVISLLSGDKKYTRADLIAAIQQLRP